MPNLMSSCLGLTEMWRYRDLLRELTLRELKGRYRRSVLGFLWSMITPLYQVLIYTVVIKFILNPGGTRNLSVDILVGIIPWTFFSVAILNSCAAILRFRGVVKKVYFPRQMVVLGTVASNLIHLVLSALVMLVVFLLVPVKFHSSFWFLVPLILLQTLLVCGLALIACASHTYFQDVEFVLTNLFQVGMFLTPVLYRMERIEQYPELYQIIYKLNPMAIFIEGWRGILLRNEYPDPFWLAIAGGTSLLVLMIGLAVWQRTEWRFPEVI